MGRSVLYLTLFYKDCQRCIPSIVAERSYKLNFVHIHSISPLYFVYMFHYAGNTGVCD